MKTDLHERIAAALGWSVQETQSFSLRTLRDLVNTVDPGLAQEISSLCDGVLVMDSNNNPRRPNL